MNKSCSSGEQVIIVDNWTTKCLKVGGGGDNNVTPLIGVQTLR